MSSHRNSSDSTTTIQPPYLIRARSGSFIETLGGILFRVQPSPPPKSDPNYRLLRMVSKMTVKDIKGAKCIGSGGYGEVYVFERPTGKVALKRLRGGDDLQRVCTPSSTSFTSQIRAYVRFFNSARSGKGIRGLG